MKQLIADKDKCSTKANGGACCMLVEDYMGECLKHSLPLLVNDDRNDPCMEATGGKALYMCTDDELKDLTEKVVVFALHGDNARLIAAIKLLRASTRWSLKQSHAFICDFVKEDTFTREEAENLNSILEEADVHLVIKSREAK